MRVLITGGAGFLGYHLANFCERQGAQVRIVDLLPPDRSEYPAGVDAQVGDVRDPALMDRAMRWGEPAEPVDAVIHTAAALPLWRPSDIRTTTVDGTRVVLDAARRAGVDRVVYISSTAVYGIPQKHPTDEEDPLEGIGPYGESKVLAEQVCEEFRSQGACVPILRPKTFLGTGRLGVFQILYEWVYEGRRIPVLGSGRNRYQLLDVEDLCEAIWKAASLPAAVVNDTFNVGASEFGTVLEDLRALCIHAASGARVRPVPARPAQMVLRMLEAVNLSPLYRWIYDTADKDSYVSIDRIENALGWRPRVSNQASLIKSYDWYVANRSSLTGTGLTHRVAWAQGALNVVKRVF